MAKVDRAEHYGLAKSIKQIGNTRNWENIELHLVIQVMVINANPKFANLFMHKQYRGSIRQDTRPYPPLLKQLIHLLLPFGLLSLTQSILPMLRWQ